MDRTPVTTTYLRVTEGTAPRFLFLSNRNRGDRNSKDGYRKGGDETHKYNLTLGMSHPRKHFALAGTTKGPMGPGTIWTQCRRDSRFRNHLCQPGHKLLASQFNDPTETAFLRMSRVLIRSGQMKTLSIMSRTTSFLAGITCHIFR